MKRTTTQQPPMLPGMGRPEFGGVQLRPGMESQRAYTGPQMGLFDQPATATQDTMLDDAEQGNIWATWDDDMKRGWKAVGDRRTALLARAARRGY